MTLPSGAVFIDIALEQVDAKSPVDDVLMTSIDEDLYYLKNQLATSSGGVYEWKVNGNLSSIASALPFRRIDAAFVMTARTLSGIGLFLDVPGTSGVLEVDVRKYRTPLTPIIGIDLQYSGSISSITRAGSSGSTQSIARATPQVNTQSISFWKSAINVNSVIYMGSNLWRYNLATAPDSDHKVGDSIKFASMTSGANNGTFTIVKINEDSGFNITIANSAGVAQTSAAGNAQLMAFAYTFTNPANASFVVGESAVFATHTTGANNGTFAIYAVNSGGNNLIIKNSAGVAQAGVAGTVDVLRFTYTLGATVSTDIQVGESALFATHTSAVNDGNLPVRAISGSTLTVYNVLGATQGGVAGTVNSNRWIYALGTDPSTSFSVGHTAYITGATSFLNNGIFTVVQINRLASNNLVFYNLLGATQVGAAGTITHTRRIIKFSSDQSAVFAVTTSRIAVKNIPDGALLNKEYTVVEVNRGGGANFNIVINDSTGLSVAQASPAGRVVFESRSVFSTRPTITIIDDLQIGTDGVLDTTEKTVAANRVLAMEILQLPSGNPQNLSVHVS